MPIVDLQRRLHEAGRIRIGRQVPIASGRAAGKTRPERLEQFRFTSPSRRALDAVAALHGGDVAKWEGAPAGEQWELLSPANEIPVIVPPEAMGFSQSYELWSGGGCQRRCDGETESISDGPCLCDAEARECKPHTRLSVMLVGVQGVGLWRLDTQGWYAAAELQGAHGIAQLLAASLNRSILPARLRVEARTVKRTDPKTKAVTTRNFVVPVLDFDVDVAAVALAGVPQVGVEALPAPTNGVTPVPALLPPTLAEQLEEVDNQAPPPARRNSPPPLPRTGATPRPAAAVPVEPSPAPESPAVPSTPDRENGGGGAAGGTAPSDTAAPPAQSLSMKRMHSMFNHAKVEKREDRLAIVKVILDREVGSSKELSDQEMDTVSSRLVDVVEKRVDLVRSGSTWSIR